MKYVIIRDDATGEESALTCDDEVVHATIVPKTHLAVSAGSWSVGQDGLLQTGGGSESLGLESRPEDLLLLASHLLGLSVLDRSNLAALAELRAAQEPDSMDDQSCPGSEGPEGPQRPR
jgi:hypothetical protein